MDASPKQPNPEALEAPTIRDARTEDLAAITGFQQAMAQETEGRLLDGERLAAGVRSAFEDPTRGRYLVAERDGEVVGSLLLTREWSDWRNGWFWWIQSVYVVAAARRTGVYGALYAQAVRDARKNGDVCGLRLYVEEQNQDAQRVYEALGMKRSSYQFYEVEF